jgi:hypothetical protein
VPAFWQQLEADFGQNNAMGMVDMIQEFEAALSMDFGSVAELFQRLQSVRNRLNQQGQETLRVHLILSQLMIDKVLSLSSLGANHHVCARRAHLGKGGEENESHLWEQEPGGGPSHEQDGRASSPSAGSGQLCGQGSVQRQEKCRPSGRSSGRLRRYQ